MKKLIILLICILVLSGAACVHTGISKDMPLFIDAEVYYSGTQCNGPEQGPSAEWVLDPDHLSAIYNRLHRHLIDSKSIRPPEVDFSGFVLLMVDMGRMPSAGYGIDLAAATVTVVSGTAKLRILWTEPDAESLQAQVVSSPCVMVKLPKTGYASIDLTDQNDTVLLKLALSVK